MDTPEKTNKFCCSICNKTYTKLSSLKNHTIICEFSLKTEREKKIENEEQDDMPDHAQLVKIVMDLTQKCHKLESQVEQMKKWVDRKKKKINVIQWLNTNTNASFSFSEFVNMYLELDERHLMNIMEKTLFEFIYFVYDTNMSKSDIVYPIKSFTEKNNYIYVCDKLEDGTSMWKPLELDHFKLLLKKIQNKMITLFLEWKTSNSDKMNDRRMEDKYNKGIVKLMNISFNQDATMSRMKTDLYNYVKTDLKSVIEYDFEF
jgi:hypothetical protein